MNRRIGKFTMTKQVQQNPGDLNIFDRAMVLDVREDVFNDRVDYVMTHPCFNEVGEGCVIPEYRAEFRQGYPIPHWTKLD